MRHGKGNLVRLFSAIIFGILLELATLRQLDAYHYGRFLIMIGDVPLCIAVAWGSIIYSVMEFADATSLPRWARPVLAGLLALNIDLALDAVAVRLELWDWGRSLAFQYYGVPYANFLAWFWVVASFSGAYRLLSQWKTPASVWLAGVFAVILGLVVVLATNGFMAFVIPLNYHIHLAFLLFAAALVFLFSLQPRLHQRPVPSLAFLVPFLTLLYVLVAGLTSGAIVQPPELLVVELAMLGILFYLHRFTIRHFLQGG
jgi:hypothetical protein